MGSSIREVEVLWSFVDDVKKLQCSGTGICISVGPL